MMASKARLSGPASCELVVGTLPDSVIAAGGRGISVGISAALFCLLRYRRGDDRPDARRLRHQMAIAAEHSFGFVASRRVKRFEDENEQVSAFRPRPRFGFNGAAAHR